MAIMSNTAILWSCAIAITICIILNFKWDIDLGLLGISAAFLIGCLFHGDKAATVYGYWPDDLIFFLIASGLFFGFATENGTLEVFGNKLVRKFRRNTLLIPWAIFIIATVVTILGAGTSTMFFLAPISFAIGMKIGMDPMVTVFVVNIGFVAGQYNPWTGIGVVMKGLVEKDMGTAAMPIYVRVYGILLIKQVICMAVFYVYYCFIKKQKDGSLWQNRSREIVVEEGACKFNPVQRKTFILILLSFFLIVTPSFLNAWGFGKGNVFFANVIKLCQPQTMCVIFAVLASIMKLGDLKKVVAHLPMTSILLIAGVTFLMEIASSAGLLDVVAGWFSKDMAVFLVVPFLCIVAGILSFFSSATTVVCPMMFPLVPVIAAATGINPVTLYSTILMGAGGTNLSPFSTAGAQFIGLAPDKLKEGLVPRLVLAAIAMFVLTILLAVVGLYGIFPI